MKEEIKEFFLKYPNVRSIRAVLVRRGFFLLTEINNTKINILSKEQSEDLKSSLVELNLTQQDLKNIVRWLHEKSAHFIVSEMRLSSTERMRILVSSSGDVQYKITKNPFVTRHNL